MTGLVPCDATPRHKRSTVHVERARHGRDIYQIAPDLTWDREQRLPPAIHLVHEAAALSETQAEEERVDENHVPQPGATFHDGGEAVEVGVPPLQGPDGDDADDHAVR